MAAIMLVDDHPAICFALKVLLEKTGDFAVSSSDGDNLIGLLHRACPDLLILDLELKNADGLDLLPRLKHHFPALKILIFTNQPAAIYAPRTLQGGADGFINKSLTLSNVEPLCRLILEGYQCFPQGAFGRINAGQTQTMDGVLSRFSDREIAVLNYLRQGRTNKEIGDLLMLSNKTISTYKARMLQKSGVDSLEKLFALLQQDEDAR